MKAEVQGQRYQEGATRFPPHPAPPRGEAGGSRGHSWIGKQRLLHSRRRRVPGDRRTRAQCAVAPAPRLPACGLPGAQSREEAQRGDLRQRGWGGGEREWSLPAPKRWLIEGASVPSPTLWKGQRERQSINKPEVGRGPGRLSESRKAGSVGQGQGGDPSSGACPCSRPERRSFL